MTVIDPVQLTQQLIRCRSITPEEGGALGVLEAALKPLGFKCERIKFQDKGTPPVENLYARLGTKGPNLCFAGHVDVVPPGDLKSWTVDPFAGTVKKGRLIGRGASDMKGAIAAWVAAISAFMSSSGLTRGSIHNKIDSRLKAENDKVFSGSLSLLITCDEEGPGVNGTVKVLEWLKKRSEKLDACIVGEPTNPRRLGEMIKNGRRGSVSFTLTVFGVQGHVAYPHLADNPMPKLLAILRKITSRRFDKGNEYFDPTHLEVTALHTDNTAHNVIPARAQARFNIRFNDIHRGKELEAWVKDVCAEVTADYKLETQISGEAFLTEPGKLTNLVMMAVEQVTGMTPELSTTGGTSDARFIKDYCPVVEFGLTNETAHKVDENVKVEDLQTLTEIYQRIIKDYF